MGLFNFLKKKHLSTADKDALSKAVKDIIGQIADAPFPEPMSNEEYQKMRLFEQEWLEVHYDLNSLDGIKRIPSKKGLRCPETSGVTGRLYYYLRHKAYEHEKNGNMDLAIACMSKSSELATLDYGTRIMKQDLYPLVKMLARSGQIEEAICEKEFVDQYCDEQEAKLAIEGMHQVLSCAKTEKTDYIIMDATPYSCPECAKYQGRVYSISGKSKKFPKLPDFIMQAGRVHKPILGCVHSFYSYIDGMDDSLELTLEAHPLKNKMYGRNIVTFSNRPFVDDRTSVAKEAAQEYLAELAADAKKDDNMIEHEAKRGNDMRDYFWIRENIPQKCPKSLTGYRRMKTQNTKNYQVLKQLAAELGRKI